MVDKNPSGKGDGLDVQREFDFHRDVVVPRQKLRNWALNGDPVMADLGGEPWWRIYQQRVSQKHQSGKPRNRP